MRLVAQSRYRTDYQKQLSSSGNTLVEYAFVSLMLLVVVIGGFQLIGLKVNSALSLVGNTMSTGMLATNGILIQNAQAKAAFTSSVSSQIKVDPVALQLGNIPNLGNSVQTTGANGTTALASLQLKNLASQLLSSGQISQEEANRLIALANQGLRIASLESQIEAASKSSASNAEFISKTVTFDGTTYSMMEAAALLGFGSLNGPEQDLAANNSYMLDPATANPETGTFLTLYQQAINSPGLINSGAQDTVQRLSAQISYLSDVTDNLIYGANFATADMTTLNSQVISQATTFDSTTIAQLGTTPPTP